MTEIAAKDRKAMEERLACVFHDNLVDLATELREILLDDIVTALENRLKVLNSASMQAHD